MGVIHKLNPKIANMIAAGEVIERLGNVVKELVENAIDAHATQITIQLWEAGMKKIIVSDNGSGMEKDDAILAFERHATSKIVNEFDLFHLSTLGFRGEALASIGSVAKVILKTATQSPSGTLVVFDNGKLTSVDTIAYNKGSSFEVSHLFYQLPARYKHLKSPQVELAYTVDLVNKLALAHPQIAFLLSNDERVILKTDGNNQTETVMASIYGMRVVRDLLRFDHHNRDYHIIGFLASPLFNRSSRNAMTLIANDRPIRNYKTLQAVIDGFHHLIPKGRYPVAVIKIITDPLLIDANVHPTKQDVKFSEETELHTLISDTIRQTLAKQAILEQPQMPVSHENVREHLSLFESPTEAYHPYKSPPSGLTEEVVEPVVETKQVDEPQEKEPPKRTFPEWDYIGQYLGTYLLFQNDKGLYLMDQHAAAERIRYERYSVVMGKETKATKPLLIPFELTFSNSELQLIQPYLQELKQWGLFLEATLESLVIQSVPIWFEDGDELSFSEAMVRTLLNEKPLSVALIRDELAILLACKHSIKANRYINSTEVATLVADLKRCRNPYTCPHGRPIIVEIDQLTIEKWFKRVM